MSKATAVGGFVVLVVLALMFIIIYQFGFMSTASSDIGVNLTGTSYQASYNQSGNTTRAAFATFSFLPILLGVIALIFALMLLFTIAMRR